MTAGVQSRVPACRVDSAGGSRRRHRADHTHPSPQASCYPPLGMSDQTRAAVFLSYASQDAEAARRICDALRAAGVEVWLDQSGLKGGAAWDAEIRRSIHDCALFVPIISANTESRLEGYFRLEWRLAEQRSHLMALGKPFLVPVVIDNTSDEGAHVPNAFVDVQWTRVTDRSGADSFARHVRELLAKTAVAGATHTHEPAPMSGAIRRGHGVIEAARKPRFSAATAALAAVLLAAVAGGYWLWQSRQTNPAQPAISSADAAPVAAVQASSSPPRTAVAVLPFANLTGDASMDYLGDGMAEELINTLTRIPGLKVPARTSAFAYKGRNVNIRDIAKDLQVGTILEGSVRAAGKRIRITAQLINAEDGLHLWSENYDEEFTDIFKLQDKLAAQIAKALHASLSDGGIVAVARPPTQDVEAYRLYLQGVSLGERAATNEDYQRSVDLLAQAVTRDPTFGRAHGALAVALLPLYGRGQSPAIIAAAEKHARQALQLGAEVNARYVLATISGSAGKWSEMEEHGRAMLAAGGADANTWHYRALHLRQVGRLAAALGSAQRAYELAPANARIAATLAMILHLLGREAEALQFASTAVALGLPVSDSMLVNMNAQAARSSGDQVRVVNLLTDSYSRVFESDDSRRQLTIDIIRLGNAALTDSRQRAAALAAVSALGRSFSGGQSPSTNAPLMIRGCMMGVRWYVLLGALDDAHALAMQCPAIGNGTAVGFAVAGFIADLWDQDMRPFRRDPRFQSFANRLHLMDYWQQYGPPDDCDLRDGKLTCR